MYIKYVLYKQGDLRYTARVASAKFKMHELVLSKEVSSDSAWTQNVALLLNVQRSSRHKIGGLMFDSQHT